MKATREVEEIITIKLDLKAAGMTFFSLARGYLVQDVSWKPKDTTTNSHPVTVNALDENDCRWTLSLRWSDLPEPVQEALIEAAAPGDVPDVAAWGVKRWES